MKLRELNCPKCNGQMSIALEDNKIVFCPYCGTQFLLDDGKIEIIVNKNVQIDKKYVNETEIVKAKYEDKKDRRSWFAIFGLFIMSFVIIGSVLFGLNVSEKNAINEGKIQAGYYDDLLGENYKTVEAHFKAAGFTNIELIDLNDSGIAFWNQGKVETISVGGDTTFNDTDWYSPDAKVVISYH